MVLIKTLKNYKISFNFFSLGEKMKELYDSWFDELFDELSWDFVCKEQENHDKAAYLAISFFPQEGDYQFAKKWIFGRPKPFCDFIFSLKNESRNNINP